jgi:hypothetical protein
MNMSAKHESRTSNRVWAGALLVGLISTACDSGDGSLPSSFGADPNSGSSTDTAVNALCGGEVVPPGDDDGYSTYEGDTAFIVDDWSVTQVDLRTGDRQPMFTIDNHDDGLINAYVVDDKDFYAVTDFELYRYNRATQQLSLVSRAPDSPVATTFLGITTFAHHLALSSTQVLTIPYDTEGTASGGAQFRRYLGLFDRATNALQLTPLEGGQFLEFLGDKYYFEDSRIEMLSPGVTRSHPQVSTYDPATNTTTLLATDIAEDLVLGGMVYFTTSNGTDAEFTLSRVSPSGGVPEVLDTSLRHRHLVGHGTKLYVELVDPDAFSSSVLTELDVVSGERRTLGTCIAGFVHASDTAVYILPGVSTDVSNPRLLRIPL